MIGVAGLRRLRNAAPGRRKLLARFDGLVGSPCARGQIGAVCRAVAASLSDRTSGYPEHLPHSTHQVAALPVRTTADHRTEILLVTSRETRRWVLPKGWVQAGMDAPGSAAAEAWEEAGVRGEICAAATGTFDYVKRKPFADVPVTVTVYRLVVSETSDEWPEMRQRSRAWFTPAAAAAAVDEEGLKRVLMGLR